jgi:hypothetical protein
MTRTALIFLASPLAGLIAVTVGALHRGRPLQASAWAVLLGLYAALLIAAAERAGAIAWRLIG